MSAVRHPAPEPRYPGKPLITAWPAVSIVIEWENARLSELGRTRRMLSALAAQLAELVPGMPAAPELILLHDAGAVDPALIRSCVETAFAAGPAVSLRIEATQGAGYYVQKNLGAALAAREILLFLDSDVVPEPGWLRTLLGSFADPALSIVCGNTYIEPEGLYAKAFAAFWFFPLRSEDATLRETHAFFANNVAFRRDLFLRNRFPDLPLLRGQCAVLSDGLRRGGTPIHLHGGARVAHPPPKGLGHYLRRALCEGHDIIQLQRLGKTMPGGGMPWGPLRRFGASFGHARRSLRAHRGALGLRRGEVPLALAVAGGYLVTRAAGEVLGRLASGFVRRRLAV